MNEPLKVGLVGFGISAKVFHAPFITTVPGFELVSVLERTNTESPQTYPSVRVVRSLEELVDDKEIQLVVITTTNETHYPYAEKALQAGKHVVLEKPFTNTTDEAKKLIALAMFTGITVNLVYFMFVVLQLDPWYNPQYFIPIGGMIIGKTMTGVSLGVNNLLTGMRDRQANIEGALMLGASPKTASKSIVNEAFDQAMLPTVNAMVGMGIVFLPGMMTGQIIAGQAPTTAIKYQISVMLGVAGTVSITVLIFLHLAYKLFFNEREQFILTKRDMKKKEMPVKYD